MDTVEAVNTHCKKVNDFRDSKMLPSATPMKIIPEEWKGSNPIATPAPALPCWTMMKRVCTLCRPPAVEVIDN